jgi:hypothetical protein
MRFHVSAVSAAQIIIGPIQFVSIAYRGGSTAPTPKFRSFDKAESNSQFRGKHIRNNLIRIRISLIFKLSAIPD